MKYLYLHLNAFEGETDFTQIPDSLMFISVAHTKLAGYVPSKSGRRVHVTGSGVKVCANG
eukprot:CAMPEP_0201506790 /NCGR_PEP_ID=MMETSP0161_2-20130828/641_1 /ASSEMBLY_ACC=CAM_ASM_000251 /TAXON_ID=180227 /ORGANISM="Neoparamoeba aestuarina, Strain SoJaBio B1-5/56/2" /LENGTH=59 /DNA_ID=CAMNT_0047900985 /DNA_START=408 /DNA_END=587 /DNA_ORIENTATION=+